MRKNYILILILFFHLTLFAEINWNLDINSYTGGKVYLNYKNIFNHMNYHPKNKIKFHMIYKKTITIDTILKNGKSSTNDIVLIHRLSVFYKTKSYKIGFLKDFIGYGKNSYYYNSHILSAYFDKFIFGNYNFYGFFAQKYYNNLNFSLKAGGNKFNREIFDISASYHLNKNNFTIFGLKTVKDNFYNSEMFAGGMEFTVFFNKLNLNGLLALKFYNELDNSIIKKEILFFETNFFPNKNIIAGADFLHNHQTKDPTDEINIFICIKNKKFPLELAYKRFIFNEKYDNKATLIGSYIIKKLKIEIISSYGKSFENKDYLELGFNLNWKI